jgi:pantoate--beta-alanine ligase
MTKIIRSVAQCYKLCNKHKMAGQSIGFVPTMGNLHAGHLSLLKKAQQANNITVLSIFVNPTQFDGPNDLKNYPRTFAADFAAAQRAKVDYVFVPEYAAMYPDKYHYKIIEMKESLQLCGKSRAKHFSGMLTVVMKFLLLIQPARAYFGEKDWQQLQLVKAMAQAFFMDVKIIACSTVRDANGLALSSRNSKLSTTQYIMAVNFPRLLHAKLTTSKIRSALEQLGFKVDYIIDKNYGNERRRFGAVKIGEIRLIDNVKLDKNNVK